VFSLTRIPLIALPLLTFICLYLLLFSCPGAKYQGK
jgi:hypothetical protein